MVEGPLVSIVLPTYNGSKFLKQSIKSCIEQTYPNWELIIVDDASIDNTPDIIKSLCLNDSRIKYIRHTENRRLPAALNTGFNAAKGNYLTWTSDDNWFDENALSEMVDFLETNTSVAVVYTNFFNVSGKGEVIGPVEVLPAEELINFNCIGACFLYRRTVHERLGTYDESLYLAEDYDFWLRALAQFTLKPLEKYLYYYRCHGLSLTSQKRRDILIATKKTILKNLPNLHWLNPEGRAKAYLRLARISEELSNFFAARYYLSKAIVSSWKYVFHADKRYITKLYLGDHISNILDKCVTNLRTFLRSGPSQ